MKYSFWHQYHFKGDGIIQVFVAAVTAVIETGYDCHCDQVGMAWGGGCVLCEIHTSTSNHIHSHCQSLETFTLITTGQSGQRVICCMDVYKAAVQSNSVELN